MDLMQAKCQIRATKPDHDLRFVTLETIYRMKDPHS